jgi:hypothetical protein
MHTKLLNYLNELFELLLIHRWLVVTSGEWQHPRVSRIHVVLSSFCLLKLFVSSSASSLLIAFFFPIGLGCGGSRVPLCRKQSTFSTFGQAFLLAVVMLLVFRVHL